MNEANFVRKCIGAESCQDDLWGKLVCTNFKVSFIAHNSLPRRVSTDLRVSTFTAKISSDEIREYFLTQNMLLVYITFY